MPEDQSTEDRIKDAAKAVFVQKGYAGARMEEIAKEAGGINKALLHYYFRSKEKLFDEVFQEVFEDVMPKLNAVLKIEGHILDKIDAFVEEYIRNIRLHPHIPLFVIHELNQNPERFLQKVSSHPNSPNINSLVMEIIRAMEAGEIKKFPPIQLLLNVISMCVFPFIARPIIQAISQMEASLWEQMMDERAAAVKAFIRSALEI